MQNALGRISPQTVDDSGIKLKLSGGVLRRAAGSSVALIEGTDTEGQDSDGQRHWRLDGLRGAFG